MLNIMTISPKNLHPILAAARRHKMSVLILGEPGCGKTQMTTDFANKYCDGNLIDLRLTTVQATDVRGMCFPDLAKNQTRFLPPEFLPDPETTNGVLFFDEFDRAGPAEQAAAMSLILERRSGNVKLPDGWLVVCAGNGIEFSDNTYEFDAAMADRLICIRMVAQPEATVEYFTESGVGHPLVCSFLQRNPDALSQGKERREKGMLVGTSARGWERFSTFLFERDEHRTMSHQEDLLATEADPIKRSKIKGEMKRKLESGETSMGLDDTEFQAIAFGILGEYWAGRFFTYMEELEASVPLFELMEATDDRVLRSKLPSTEVGLFYLGFSLVSMVKDLKTARRTLHIVNEFPAMAERNPNLPIADAQAMTAEKIFDKAINELKIMDIAYAPEYDRYLAGRDEVTNGIRLD